MKIKVNNATRKMFDPEISDEPLKFDNAGKAKVKKSVGKKFVEKYNSISKVKTKKKPKKKKSKKKDEVK